MSDRSSIFDMIGPIMIGPSSSHTAGVVKIGRTARHLFEQQPEKAHITFYNSFAKTYEGHGSDRAIIAGLLDMKPDDERIREAFDHGRKSNLDFQFKAVHNDATLHPNTVSIRMVAGEKTMTVKGISRGGGLISIIEVDGFTTHFSGHSRTLLIKAKDVKGSIAFISNVISHDDCNIATMTVNRTGKNDLAKLVIEVDSDLRELTIQYLSSLSWVIELTDLPSLDV